MAINATRVDDDTFTVTGNQTDIFHEGRRVKMMGDSTAYGTILSSSYSTNTTVNLTSGSDTVPTGTLTVLYGIVSSTEASTSMPTHDHEGEGSGGNITASAISDFDTEVANNSAVTANTAKVSCTTTNVTSAGALMDSELTSLSGIKTLTVPDNTTISTFGASLVNDADAAAARTTLGAEPADSTILKEADVDDTPVNGVTTAPVSSNWAYDHASNTDAHHAESHTIASHSDTTATGAELNILDGATLSTAELNVLDGITATTTELNYVHGVTSTIQTQLDAKGTMDDVVDDTTPQLGGNLDWNSNGIMLVGQTVGGSDGDLVYLSSANTWSQADADAESTCSGMLGIRISSTTVLTHGVYTTSGLTAGSKYYASTTAGGMTTTAPSATGDIVRIVGYALSTTEFFFDPDKSYVEIGS